MEYRLYIMDGMGKIGSVERITAGDDQEAVKLACEKKFPVACEVGIAIAA